MVLGALALVSCNVVWGIGDLTYDESQPGGGHGGVGGTTSGTGGGSSSSGTGAGGAGGGGLGGGGTGGTGGSGGAGGQGGSGGSGGPPIGCSDGTREAYTNVTAQPNIAGCDGGFDVPGVTSSASMQPTCNRQAGNDSGNPNGLGCSVADLCAAGWHVCMDGAEVAQASSTGQCPMTSPSGDMLWIVRQGQASGAYDCSASGDDNLLGCGFGLGSPPGPYCEPLNRRVQWLSCGTLTAWTCGPMTNVFVEAAHVTKPSPAEGGALCCRD